jgi:hypothetical protein
VKNNGMLVISEYFYKILVDSLDGKIRVLCILIKHDV